MSCFLLESDTPPPKGSLCKVALHPKGSHYFSTWNGKTWSTFAFSAEAAVGLLTPTRRPFFVNQPIYYQVIRLLERNIMSSSVSNQDAVVLTASDLPAFFGNPSAIFAARPKRKVLKPTARKAQLAPEQVTRKATRSSPAVPSAWGAKGRPAKVDKPARTKRLQLTPWFTLSKTPPHMEGAYEVRMRNPETGERLVKTLKWSDAHEAFRGVQKGFVVRAYRGLTKAAYNSFEPPF